MIAQKVKISGTRAWQALHGIVILVVSSNNINFPLETFGVSVGRKRPKLAWSSSHDAFKHGVI